MPYGDALHKEIVAGALNLVQAVLTDIRLTDVHIAIDLSGKHEFGSYVTIKFAKPNTADPLCWALIDFMEHNQDTNCISTLLMLRHKGTTQGDSQMVKLHDMQSAQIYFEQVLEFLAKY
jgi:hypothetical protein